MKAFYNQKNVQLFKRCIQVAYVSLGWTQTSNTGNKKCLLLSKIFGHFNTLLRQKKDLSEKVYLYLKESNYCEK